MGAEAGVEGQAHHACLTLPFRDSDQLSSQWEASLPLSQVSNLITATRKDNSVRGIGEVLGKESECEARETS